MMSPSDVTVQIMCVRFDSRWHDFDHDLYTAHLVNAAPGPQYMSGVSCLAHSEDVPTLVTSQTVLLVCKSVM